MIGGTKRNMVCFECRVSSTWSEGQVMASVKRYDRK